MTFQSIQMKYRKHSFSERDKGDRFEQLMQAYLQSDPKYACRFKHICYGILDLLLSIINVSVKTVELVAGLSELKWE